jgi:hypothetical protein
MLEKFSIKKLGGIRAMYKKRVSNEDMLVYIKSIFINVIPVNFFSDKIISFGSRSGNIRCFY